MDIEDIERELNSLRSLEFKGQSFFSHDPTDSRILVQCDIDGFVASHLNGRWIDKKVIDPEDCSIKPETKLSPRCFTAYRRAKTCLLIQDLESTDTWTAAWDLHFANRFEEAEDLHLKAVQEMETRVKENRVRAREGLALAQWHLAKCLCQIGNFSKAQQYFDEARNEVENWTWWDRGTHSRQILDESSRHLWKTITKEPGWCEDHAVQNLGTFQWRLADYATLRGAYPLRVDFAMATHLYHRWWSLWELNIVGVPYVNLSTGKREWPVNGYIIDPIAAMQSEPSALPLGTIEYSPLPPAGSNSCGRKRWACPSLSG